ncbi:MULTISPECIES: SDR family NAD(P)-dependent oxidoreductase [Streptomyces]|uniref:SDR family NAD(P)-dependent oxidoreductase n=1 Tax=Streptomyces TaxID=1883 RepID=UPI00167A7809|nr:MULTISPECIES: SDR family NAD(P)-dependent oxidoreductase [Streptomyces]MBK3524189.1 SDR family NAD(P)-dependent oxidoreductase [Streptomyces sp. MBT70]GGR55055.1 oxidoreductase [Streptomyces eurythermus]
MPTPSVPAPADNRAAVPGLITTPFDASATAREVLVGVDLTGKRALVTGGASGIGTETVRALAEAGAEVTVAVRRPETVAGLVPRVDAVRGAGRVRAARLDLADIDSVRALTDSWEGPLDILVANAGIMALPDLERSGTGWELQLATNYLGHFALALGLRDALRRAGSARVVAVSSGAHRRHPVDLEDPQFEHTPYDRWVAYGRSKSAMVLLAVGIAERWAPDGITANALMPGWITTRLQRHLDLETLRAMGAADEAGNRVEQPFYKSTEQGAATSVLLAASPLLEGVTGRYFEDNQEAPVTCDGTGDGVAAHALDRVTADRLWEYARSRL